MIETAGDIDIGLPYFCIAAIYIYIHLQGGRALFQREAPSSMSTSFFLTP